VSAQSKSRTRAIKDVKFTDGHVWIYGTVQSIDGDHVEIDDGTGTIAFDMVVEGNSKSKNEDVLAPTVVKGDITEGAYIRVIGDVVADTSKNFTLVPKIIQNLNDLGIDKELFSRIRSLEDKFGEET